MTRDSHHQGGSSFDLAERTALFGEEVVTFVKKTAGGTLNEVLLKQLLRAGTSIGANYTEADEAASKRDFRHKIALCKKEAKETMYWFRMVVKAEPDRREKAKVLWQEAKELMLIFAAILRSKPEE